MSRHERLGELLAHVLAEQLATWRFVVWMAISMVVWIIWQHVVPPALRFDPYPFILFNLVLSGIAAFTAPILLIADGYRHKRDFEVLRRIEHKLDQLLKSEK